MAGTWGRKENLLTVEDARTVFRLEQSTFATSLSDCVTLRPKFMRLWDLLLASLLLSAELSRDVFFDFFFLDMPSSLACNMHKCHN